MINDNLSFVTVVLRLPACVLMTFHNQKHVNKISIVYCSELEVKSSVIHTPTFMPE